MTLTDNGDGTATLSGTPAAGTGGAYPITITATNGVSPDATQAFTLTVDQAPTITSSPSTTFTVGSAGTFSVTSVGNPAASLSENGALPAGVTFTDNGDGTATLSGTPAAGTGGAYPITITATNGVSPDATQAFTLTVDQAPTITSGTSTTFTVGSAGTFSVTTHAFPAPAISETGNLPSGVTFHDNGDGTASLSGTPTHGSGGKYPLTVTASNEVGNDATQSFNLTVDEAPYFTSANSASFSYKESSSFKPTAAGYPAPAITVWGTLPKGITFTNGSLAGTPTKKGTVQVLFTASNGISPNATQIFSLTVVAFAVSTTSLPVLTEGTPYNVQLQAVGGLEPYTWKAVGSLPPGLQVSKSGLLLGTVTGVTPKNYTINVTVSDHSKPTKMTASASLTLTIQSGS